MIAGWLLFIATMSFYFGYNTGKFHGVRITSQTFNDMIMVALGYLDQDTQKSVLKAMENANKLLAVCEPKK